MGRKKTHRGLKGRRSESGARGPKIVEAFGPAPGKNRTVGPYFRTEAASLLPDIRGIWGTGRVKQRPKVGDNKKVQESGVQL